MQIKDLNEPIQHLCLPYLVIAHKTKKARGPAPFSIKGHFVLADIWYLQKKTLIYINPLETWEKALYFEKQYSPQCNYSPNSTVTIS